MARTNVFSQFVTARLGRPDRLSRTGLLVATVFFAASLTPSLVPRTWLFQGVVSGVSLAVGYGLGTLGRWSWLFLQLRVPAAGTQRTLTRVLAVLAGAWAILFLWQASAWQNAVRGVMGLDPVSSSRPVSVALAAVTLFGVILFVVRFFRRTMRALSIRFARYLPPRVAAVVGVIATAILFWGAIDRVVLAWVLGVADRVSQEVDATIPPDMAPPTDPRKTGSAASLIDWRNLGQAGRTHVALGPTAARIAEVVGGDAQEPIRVYVGLNAAETPEARAALALRELDRVGAFERATLLLVTPTGTGWVDPAALDTIEYLLRGDIASVAMQYSYLPSVLALPTDGAYGAENARALFQAVYGHWTTLPRQTRPRLYLYGVSLGALNSDLSFDLHDIIADPFHGALWTGPPFRGVHWNTITANREPGTPIWRPQFRGGSVVRFMTQAGGLGDGSTPWGSFRIAYLQYGSDPMTFFTVDSLVREPAWLQAPRAFDVSPALRWFPVVTTMQLLADMAVANTTPPGYGHNFAAAHYIDAWLALLEPPDWTTSMVAQLKAVHASTRP